MFSAGFLGTRAPLFMDVVTIIVALLPFLIMGAIKLASNGKYKQHAIAQIVLFITSLIVVTYFEIGVRVGGGFDAFMEGSEVKYGYALIVLIVHIIIATVTLGLWVITFFKTANRVSHVKYGRYTFLGIVLTAFTGIWVYLLLFVF